MGKLIYFYQSFVRIKIASGFVVLSQNIPLDRSQLILKTIILATPPYFKNKFKK